MNNLNENIVDHLFAQARAQKEQVSFAETKAVFVATQVAQATLFAKAVDLIIKFKKSIFMLSTITIVAIATFAMLPNNTRNNNTKENRVAANPTTETIVNETAIDDVSMPPVDKSQEEGGIANTAWLQLEEQPKSEPVSEKRVFDNKENTDIEKPNDKGVNPNAPIVLVDTIENKGAISDIPETLQTKCFVITEKTTIAEIEDIKTQAEAAGMKFEYRINRKKNKTKMLDIKMSFVDPKGKKHRDENYYKGGKFTTMSMGIKWRVNAEGKVVDFDGNSCEDKSVSHYNDDLESKKSSPVEVPIKPFSKLTVEGIFNIYLTQGNEASMRIETSKEQAQYVTTEQNGETLVISTDAPKHYNQKEEVNIYITVVNINELNLLGVGNVKTEGFLDLDALKLNIGGIGKTEMELLCKEIEVNVTSVGSIKLIGDARIANFVVGGVGSVDADEFMVEKLQLTSSGVGKVKVFASDEISIESTGVGNVYYYGDADVLKLENTGVGSVKKR